MKRLLLLLLLSLAFPQVLFANSKFSWVYYLRANPNEIENVDKSLLSKETLEQKSAFIPGYTSDIAVIHPSDHEMKHVVSAIQKGFAAGKFRRSF